MTQLLFVAIALSLFACTGYAEDKTQGPDTVWEDERVCLTLDGLERTDTYPSDLKNPGERYRPPKEDHDFVVLRLSFARIENVHVTGLGGRGDEKPALYDVEDRSYKPATWKVQGGMFLDPGDLASPFELVEGAKAFLVFEFPEKEKPTRLEFIYHFKETWEGERKAGRVDIKISEEKE